jgi:hypothetical protein
MDALPQINPYVPKTVTYAFLLIFFLGDRRVRACSDGQIGPTSDSSPTVSSRTINSPSRSPSAD